MLCQIESSDWLGRCGSTRRGSPQIWGRSPLRRKAQNDAEYHGWKVLNSSDSHFSQKYLLQPKVGIFCVYHICITVVGGLISENFNDNEISVHIHRWYFSIQISPYKNEEDESKSNISDIAEDMVEVSKCLNLGYKNSSSGKSSSSSSSSSASSSVSSSYGQWLVCPAQCAERIYLCCICLWCIYDVAFLLTNRHTDSSFF